MPVPTQAYGCRWGCGTKVLTDPEAMERHEKTCFGNPARKACKTCLFREQERAYDPVRNDDVGFYYCTERDDVCLAEKLQYGCPSHRPDPDKVNDRKESEK